MTGSQPRVAVVSGGAGGIGLAICTRLAEGGMSVVAADMQHGEFLDAGDSGIARAPVDVTSSRSVVELIQYASDVFGGVDYLVNAAGIAAPKPACETTDEEWDRMIDIHLGGTFRLCRAAFPALARSDCASVVNLSSIEAARGHAGRAAYAAAKAGVEALTRVLAVEFAPHGVRVNAVAPGRTRTPMVESIIRSGSISLDEIEAKIPLGAIGSPESVAASIAFLLSEEARQITGHVLVVDGGQSVVF